MTMARGQAFRSMHLQGRALNTVLAHVLAADPGGLAQLDPVDANFPGIECDGQAFREIGGLGQAEGLIRLRLGWWKIGRPKNGYPGCAEPVDDDLA